jgi:hypothetical protein
MLQANVDVVSGVEKKEGQVGIVCENSARLKPGSNRRMGKNDETKRSPTDCEATKEKK